MDAPRSTAARKEEHSRRAMRRSTPIGMVWLACLSTALLWATPALSGCGDTVEDVTPVGGDEISTVELERFARRLHLDLTGTVAEEEFISDTLTRLEADNSASVRAAIVDELLDSADFAELFVSELGNRAFAGESPDAQYDLLCNILRTVEPACMACPANADPCADCSCEPIVELTSDRASLLQSTADLADGSATTEDIERRHALSQALLGLAEPSEITTLIFELFLGRPAEPEEVTSGTAMVNGSLIPGAPAGLLFHRYGANYDDFIDIVFASEIYREATVSGVFSRYLGRLPTPIELAHFSTNLDTPADARPVIRAVVSSGEYFAQ